MRVLKDLNVKNKTVLLRTEFNVPVHNGAVHDDFRIRASFPTIRYLRDRGARIIVLAHRGRPEGKKDPNLSLDPIVKRLNRLGEFSSVLYDGMLDAGARDAIARLAPGDVLVAENIRFYPGEEAGDKEFALRLAALGDIYVNDAFGVLHRSHATQTILPTLLPSAAGLLVEKEIAELSAVRTDPAHPFVLIMGGAKVETKIRILAEFVHKADAICLGGIIANTILAGQGRSVGKSVVTLGFETEINTISLAENTLHLPPDVVVSADREGAAPVHVRAIDEVGADEMILDIGPRARAVFADSIREAALVVWNGPLGRSEVPAFAQGTHEVARALRYTKGRVIIGGGDVIDAVHEIGVEDAVDFMSTGGGAMLAYLAGEELPGIRALE